MKFRPALFNLFLILALLAAALPSPGLAEGSRQAPPQQETDGSRGTRPLPKGQRTASENFTGDPVVQSVPGVNNLTPPIVNIEGIASDGVLPPDTVGQVGKDHYVQMVNHGTQGSWIRVWDKNGAQVYNYGMNDLWPTGDPCRSYGYGDPVVLYDQLSDRWVITQFTYPPSGPYYMCIAVSRTGAPSNLASSWYLYTFNAHGNKFPDYPKFGVWPDGYYMMAHQFLNASSWAGTGVFVFNRPAMVAGTLPQAPNVLNCANTPTACQYKDLASVNSNYGGMLPVSLAGSSLPPEGSPNYFVEVDWDWYGFNDVMTLFGFKVDWQTPANTKFGRVGELAVAEYDWSVCTSTSMLCIPQQGTTQKLDSLSDRLMMSAWYRNFGTHEAIVLNHTVDAGLNTGRAGIRWYEVRKTNPAVPTIYDPPSPPSPNWGPWSLYQQGTYAPADAHHRWMGSIAMDQSGNIALGYSISSSTLYPGVRYTGRLAADPPGTLGAEQVIVAGGSFQSSTYGRWGDYSAMSVDPVDDCTFWFTQEYMKAGSGNWTTRVASFKFPTCGPAAQGELSGIISDAESGLPVPGALVQAVGSQPGGSGSASTGEDGAYSLMLIPDTYELTITASGYLPASISGVVVTDGEGTVQDAALTPAPYQWVEGTVTDAVTGWPLYARLDITGYPASPIWTDPVTGQYSLMLQETLSYGFSVSAWSGGYHTSVRSVTVAPGGQQEDFALAYERAACTAPGYSGSTALTFSSSFEGATGGSFPADGWSAAVVSGSGSWTAPTVGSFPTAPPKTGSRLASFSSYTAPAGSSNRLSRTAGLDLSGYNNAEVGFDLFHGPCGKTGSDQIQVQVSVDNGAWTSVGAPVTRTGSGGWLSHAIDISAYAGPGRTNVRIGLLAVSGNGCSLHVDDVTVTQSSCAAQPGSLLTGNVFDENTQQPLNGASIESETVFAVTDPGNLDDSNLGQGFYLTFAPAGLHSFTAEIAGGYGLAQAELEVPNGTTLRQDFSLPAGLLAASPAALDLEIFAGMRYTEVVTLENLGSLGLNYNISASPARLVDGLVMDVPEWLRNNDPTIRQALPRKLRNRTPYQSILDNVLLAPTTYQVLILSPDLNLSILKAALAPYTDLEVSVWDAAVGEPSLSDLLDYQVVMVGNARQWNTMDRTVIGDRLADYIDQGGKVIEGLYVQSFDEWGLAGRYQNEGYSPFTPATEDHWDSDTTSQFSPSGLLFFSVEGVVDRWGHQNPGLRLGAVELAAWNSSGSSYIALNENVVALNQLLHEQGNWGGDVGRILHNSVLYLAGAFNTSIPWLSLSPASGNLPPYSSIDLQVNLDGAAVPGLGQYQAVLLLENDTPYQAVAVPVSLNVIDKPDWVKTIDGETWQPGQSITLASRSTFTVVDTVDLSEEFLLTDTWNPAHLELLSFEVSRGEAALGAGELFWQVEAGEAALLTRVFRVLPGPWDEELLESTLSAATPPAISRPVTIIQDKHTLSVSVSGSGWITVEPDLDGYYTGQVVTLTAEADTGWIFYSWEGSASGTDNQLVIVMESDLEITAHFMDEALCQPISGLSFFWFPQFPVVGQPVQFTAVVEHGAEPLMYAWDFGSGSQGSGASPAHTFEAAQDYLVRLTVSNPCSAGAVYQQTVPVSSTPVLPHSMYLPLLLR